MTSGQRRTLVVTHTFPWPLESGSRLRMFNTLDGLATLGPIDLIVVSTAPPPSDDAIDAALSNLPIETITAPRVVPRSVPHACDLWSVARGRLPRAIARVDWTETRSAYAELVARHDYRLVWHHHARTVLGCLSDQIGRSTSARIIDFDDLEDQKIQLRLSVDPSANPLINAIDRLEARAWTAANARVANWADRIVVCSDDDADKFGSAGAVAVPNGLPAQLDHNRTHVPPSSSRPRLMLQGLYLYGPNIDAARFLVRDIAPLVWKEIPDAEVRVVGRGDERIKELTDDPRVIATGFVDDIYDELDEADVVVVPIRFGGGTRLKAIEAFAHRIPVVGTSVGLAGLGARHGVHAMVGDTAEDLARNIVDVLRDAALARRISDSARELYNVRFTGQLAAAGVRAVADDAIAARTGTLR